MIFCAIVTEFQPFIPAFYGLPLIETELPHWRLLEKEKPSASLVASLTVLNYKFTLLQVLAFAKFALKRI